MNILFMNVYLIFIIRKTERGIGIVIIPRHLQYSKFKHRRYQAGIIIRFIWVLKIQRLKYSKFESEYSSF